MNFWVNDIFISARPRSSAFLFGSGFARLGFTQQVDPLPEDE